MIEPCEYYPKQMNGQVISAAGRAMKDELADAGAIEDYLYSLSIETANETELENIGRIIGFVRPLVPESFTSEYLLIISQLPISSDEFIGLSSVGSEVGGELSSLALSKTGKMALGTYRKFLDKMAILKRYGVTIQSVIEIAAYISPNFTLSYNANHDIVVTYSESIGYKNLWILTQLFYRVATDPQVIVVSGAQ